MAESRGIMIAAPASGAGKTLITLGLLRALRNAGGRVSSAKVGPDYIDPRFHEAASGRLCLNLDPWAMRKELIRSSMASLSTDADLCIIEGVMGLFDGADGGGGSTAELAKSLSLPVTLVIDAKSQAQSVAALLKGFLDYDPHCQICGVIFNQVASDRHEQILRKAVAPLNVPVVGAIRFNPTAQIPSRHLGLIQAEEHSDIEQFTAKAAEMITEHTDLAQFERLCQPLAVTSKPTEGLAPLGQRIAMAKDKAFGFTYPHLLDHWRKVGAEILLFSPLAGEAPSPEADAIFLPGGYPELYADKISSNKNFFDALRHAAENNVLIYGECGGYMVMGETLTDKQGTRHKMAGLLRHSTNFQKRKLHLGYRRLRHDSQLPWNAGLRGHEFHYSTIENESGADPLFTAEDSVGNALCSMGQRKGKVMGSYAHIIDLESGSA